MNGFSRHVSRFWFGWLLIAAVVVLAIVTMRASTSPKREALASRGDEPVTTEQVRAEARPSGRGPSAQGAPVGDPARDRMEKILAMEQKRMEKGESDQRYWQAGFAEQQVNPAWARPKEREILQLVGSEQFQATDAKPSDLKVECRSSLCRLTADFPSGNAAQDWSEFFTLYSASRFSGGVTRQESLADGKARIVIITAARN